MCNAFTKKSHNKEGKKKERKIVFLIIRLNLGATPDKEIVCDCRLSHRGSMGWFVAKYLLEYSRVKVYDGSWTEWGSIAGMPIENKSLTLKTCGISNG